ncbi:MAG: ABC transporter permease [Bifidobacteriaceae bacterium]|jgi:putative spermidine/putrescine transport system permease protein|nr:ABC transporter permease [Bifidobacteriaceae bacterium]
MAGADKGVVAKAQAGRGTVEKGVLLLPVAVALVAGVLVPLVVIVVASLQDGGGAYRETFSSSLFRAALGRTWWMAVIITLGDVLIGTFYALAAASARRGLQALLLGALMFSMWTSVMVRSFGWMLLELPKGALYWLAHTFFGRSEPIELYQTVGGMYPAMFAMMLPFIVLPVLAATRNVDADQLKAARTFGASTWLTLRTVTLPAIRPAIVSAGVLVFVMSLGFYVTPLLLGGPSNLTVSGVINLEMRSANRPDLGASMSVILTTATVVVYLVSDRFFRVSEKWG